MDSLGSNCIRKVFSFFPYVPYELRYCNAKSNLYKIHVKIRRRYYHRRPHSFHVLLEFLTQEALVIKPGSDVRMHVSISRVSERENGRAESERENGRTESERENGQAEYRERASERTEEPRASERTGEPRASERASLAVTWACMY